ncbi:MAG: RNA polymerase sigma factor [Gemmataceae bacterium]
MPAILDRKRTILRGAVGRWEGDPDVRLMLRIKADEPGAFAELLDRYWPRIFGRFYKQLGDRQEAEDLAQDVFLRLYRNRRRYQARASFATWIYHIARNVARNALRSRRRRPFVSIGQVFQSEHEDAFAERLQANQQDTPSRPLEREEAAGAVRLAVAGLARRQRTALELQFQDRSYSEIAAALDMTPKAAKSLLYRARLQLRDDLNRFMMAEV